MTNLEGTLTRIIANLAISRARLRHAIATAKASGDTQYARENCPSLDLLDRKLHALVKCSPKHVIDEARDITNAEI